MTVGYWRLFEGSSQKLPSAKNKILFVAGGIVLASIDFYSSKHCFCQEGDF